MSTRQTEIRRANLGTKWEQYWRYQPNATTISEEQVSIVTGLKTKTLSTTATCFQRHADGRRTGLKIRSLQGGVGSSPTFGTHSRAVIESPSRRTHYDSTACYLRPPHLAQQPIDVAPELCARGAFFLGQLG